MSDNEQLETQPRVSTRKRKMTDKALWWQLDTLQKVFRKTLSAWSTCSHSLEILLSDSRDSDEIRKNRDLLSERMNHVYSINTQLMRLIETECQVGEHSELAKDIETDITQKYEIGETNYQTL